jgi:hypothetical protein
MSPVSLASAGSRTGSIMRVIYIAGYGHSGSTLLNILLGQLPEVMGAGELFRLAGAAWPRQEFCSCGQSLPECRIWRAIVGRWSEHAGDDAVARYHVLQRACERWLLPARRGALWRDYVGHTLGLLTAIREVTGCAVIVDSSKVPGRARALARIPGLDLRLVHLVRDGRAVAWSMRRRLERDPRAGVQALKRERSVLRTALMWTGTNLVVEHASQALGTRRAIRITYEELVGDPGAALGRLGPLLETDLSPITAQLAAGEPLAAGHVMAGNRLRMHGTLRLRPDHEWQRRLPANQQRLVERLCRPILQRYGYLAATAQ